MSKPRETDFNYFFHNKLLVVFEFQRLLKNIIAEMFTKAITKQPKTIF